MRKNWKKLRKNIPNKLHVGYGKQYEVFWQDGLKPGSDGKRVYGETRFEPNQIILDSNQSDKSIHRQAGLLDCMGILSSKSCGRNN